MQAGRESSYPLVINQKHEFALPNGGELITIRQQLSGRGKISVFSSRNGGTVVCRKRAKNFTQFISIPF